MRKQKNGGVPEQAPSYSEAIGRLREIVAQIEGAAVDVDELEVVVKEAVGLVGVCRAKLAGTQSGVELALAGLGSSTVVSTVPEDLRLIQGLGINEENPFADE